MNDNDAKYKKKSWEYSTFRKEWHELITGGHQFLFQKWMTLYKKAAVEWTNLYPKLQKKKRERNVRKKGKLSQRTCLVFLQKALCTKSQSLPAPLLSITFTPHQEKGRGWPTFGSQVTAAAPAATGSAQGCYLFIHIIRKCRSPTEGSFATHSHLYKQV